MYAFDYQRPTSVRQAANLAAKAEDAKFLAGGHTLLPTMKQRLAAPAAVINAITDALGHEDIAMPATPQAVWRAAQKSAPRMAAE